MTDNSMDTLESLRLYFKQLTAQNSQLQEKCSKLEQTITDLQKDLEDRDNRIESLIQELTQSEVRYKNLQISQKAAMDAKQLRENKERFAKLVREIDKCISLLNE